MQDCINKRCGSQPIIRALLKWYAGHARDLPWRRAHDPYAVWVSEIMLQQTQVKTVLPYWTRWLQAFPTLTALAAASPEQVLKLWEGLGYYARARHLHRAAQLVVSQYGGHLPTDYDSILELPGVGRYTAGAICSIAFNQPKPILDGNVMRVLARLFAVRGNPRSPKTNARLWALAADLVESAARIGPPNRRNCADFNQSLMELGALVCAPRQPACSSCPVHSHCRAWLANQVEQFPTRPRPRLTRKCDFTCLVLNCRDFYFIRQRPPIGVNAGLWEFPQFELANRVHTPDDLAKTMLKFKASEWKQVGLVHHSIMQQRIRLQVWRAVSGTRLVTPNANGCWRRLRDLRALPFTGAHRKIIHNFLLGRNNAI